MNFHRYGVSLLASAVAVGLLGASGCSSSQPARPEGAVAVAGPRVNSVSRIAVSLDPGLAEDRVARYEEERGSVVLEEVLRGALTEAGRWDQSGAVLDVKVTQFRLRSTSASFWLGGMAGNDNMELQVTAREGDRVIKTIPLYRSSLMGGMFMPAADLRLRRICETLAQDLLGAL